MKIRKIAAKRCEKAGIVAFHDDQQASAAYQGPMRKPFAASSERLLPACRKQRSPELRWCARRRCGWTPERGSGLRVMKLEIGTAPCVSALQRSTGRQCDGLRAGAGECRPRRRTRQGGSQSAGPRARLTTVPTMPGLTPYCAACGHGERPIDAGGSRPSECR